MRASGDFGRAFDTASQAWSKVASVYNRRYARTPDGPRLKPCAQWTQVDSPRERRRSISRASRRRNSVAWRRSASEPVFLSLRVPRPAANVATRPVTLTSVDDRRQSTS